MAAPSRAPVVASLGAAAGLAVGAALGALLSPDARVPAAPPSPSAAAAPAATPDARLRELEAEVIWWRSAYEELARSQEDDAAAPQPDSLEPPPEAAEPQAPAAGFDLPSLQSRGYTDEEARRLRERWEAHELELLYLRDRARREGWLRRPRFYGETRRLSEALRGELGDRDYDALLYGAGQHNRVVVAGVLQDSAAERAGLQSGDELVSYDGRRVFDAQELLRATSQGRAGVDTELRVRRGGEELRFQLPRGPIGIRLQPARLPPEGFL